MNRNDMAVIQPIERRLSASVRRWCLARAAWLNDRADGTAFLRMVATAEDVKAARAAAMERHPAGRRRAA